MVQFQEVFDPNKEEATIIIRRRNSDTPAETDSWVDKCQEKLDRLYESKNLINEFLQTMNTQTETFSAVTFANAFLQLASKAPELYTDIIDAVKMLSLTTIRDIDDAIHYTINDSVTDAFCTRDTPKPPADGDEQNDTGIPDADDKESDAYEV